MQQKRPLMVATEYHESSPLLIIDKQGTMGTLLAKQLYQQFLTVLVTGQTVDTHEQIIHIPYRKKIPLIPDHQYSRMFIFYSGEEEVLAMLPTLMKKAQQTNSKVFFITSLPYSSSQLFKHLSQHTYNSMHVLVYGEPFSLYPTEHNMVNTFLSQAKKYGKIEIPNDGIGTSYPIHLSDIFQAIIAVAFTSQRKARTLLLFPKHPVSELSIARILQKQNPMLKIDFRKYKGKRPVYHFPHDAEYFFADYPLEARIRSVAGKGTFFEEPKEKKKHVFPRKRQANPPLFLWIGLLCILLAPPLLAALSALTGVGALQFSLRELESGKINQAKTLAAVAVSSLGFSQIIGENLFYLDPFIKPQKDAIVAKLGVGKRLAETERDVLDGLTTLEKISQKKSSNPKKDFLHALSVFKNSFMTLQQMKAQGDLPRSAIAKLDSLEPLLLPLENTMDTLPLLLGFEGKRTYLVLFQNNMELRPGGGFIGSYGILEIEEGRVNSFKVSDVYDADGKLKVHVEPPYGLRRYLGASHWFLRDSNFAIDFPQNAKQATNFLQLETGKTVDGVIAVDTSFLKGILAAIGPVTVTDYKETVTAENFYLRTQTHVEKDFFAGSTQKKDFLQALLVAMQTKVFEQKSVSYQKLAAGIGESVLQKHVLFVFADEATQKLFTVNNLSSSLWDSRETEGNRYLDFFGVVDANLGTNKTNYYLKRSIEQETQIAEDGGVQTTATVTYTNTSNKKSPFGGNYKNYVRFVLPANSLLQEITVDGVAQPTRDAITDPALFTAKGFVPPKELEIETSVEEGKDVLGFLLIVPQGSTKKLAITYKQASLVDLHLPAFFYDLKVFKQPGTENDAYSFSLAYPDSYQLLSTDAGLTDVGGKVLYSGVLDKDKVLRAEFSKK